MKRLLLMSAAIGVFALVALFFGCEKTFIGMAEQNKPPEVWLSSGPVEGDTLGYQVHFYWGGWDPDGEVSAYEFVIASGNPTGFDPEDTTGLDKWTKTMVHDSVFRVPANDTTRSVAIGEYTYSLCDMTHTFFIRAIDLEGKRSDPVYRSFNAWTYAPYVEITVPELPSPITRIPGLGRVIKFEWTGKDPVDSPENVKDPDSVRWMHLRIDTMTVDILTDINENPWRYEKVWKKQPWVAYRAPEDSGKSTIIGDDEQSLVVGATYVFAVQAKDDAGAVTSIYDRRRNIRKFTVSAAAVPYLTVTEPFLGGFRFIGVRMRPEQRDIPPGIQLDFKWTATCEEYGGEVVCYQYGWDVSDVNNPSDWDSDCSPYQRSCSGKWFSGVHTLFIRAVDNSGSETLGQIELNIVPFSMERNLLWVDDFFGQEFIQTTYSVPTESEHDAFWLGHCQRAAGFDRERDAYSVVTNYIVTLPKITLIAKYKNIIWTYGNVDRFQAWGDVIEFIPESMISQGKVTVNYLSLYLAKGGHLLTEGNGARSGGLAAGMGAMQPFPCHLKCETTGNQEGCEGDTSGVNSFPYKDYCATMIDKIDGQIRGTTGMPKREVRNYDCCYPGMKLSSDEWNTIVPGMPEQLDLWEEVTKTMPSEPYRFFCPTNPAPYPGGFTLVEIYDPYYWMRTQLSQSQACFHPLYLMQAKSTVSGLHNQAAALWVTKYANIVPEVSEGIAVAAPSLHLGFELWYFNRAQGTTMINTLFQRWGILATQ